MADIASDTSTTRVLANGAFILGAPGTYVEYGPDCVTVGNRPGVLLWCVTGFIWCVTLAVGWLIWPHSPLIAALPSVVMGIPPILALLNRQRWEITSNALRMRGRALGVRTHRNYPLGAESQVRIGARPTWGKAAAVSQVQVLTAAGDWIGVAESGNLDRLIPLARAVAEATGLVAACETNGGGDRLDSSGLE